LKNIGRLFVCQGKCGTGKCGITCCGGLGSVVGFRKKGGEKVASIAGYFYFSSILSQQYGLKAAGLLQVLKITLK
jgi:hypothetical protein